jgi:hypothetical protein
MTERYGYRYGEEPPDSDLPASRRRGVTERHHDPDHDDPDDLHDIDLTDGTLNRDRRTEAERTGEGDRPHAADADERPHAADADDRSYPADADDRSYPADADDLPAHRADGGGFERDERDLGPAHTDATDAYDEVRDDRDDGVPERDRGPSGPGGTDQAPDLAGAERPSGGGAVAASRADLRDQDPRWASDLDHPGADRGEEVELAAPTPEPDRASVPHGGPGPSEQPVVLSAATTDTGTAATRDEASAPPATDLAAAPAATPAAAAATLLASVDAESVRRQFLDIQADFVDEPRQAVQQAGELVDDLVRQVTQALSAERERLQGSLDADTTNTEDLRLTLRAYRAYVDRLLGLTM